jgi:hypothetical protein
MRAPVDIQRERDLPRAWASGRDASCAANPYFSAKADMQTNRSRQSQRRF